jgi:glycosyltransferase involved in cell wall biosynthesis
VDSNLIPSGGRRLLSGLSIVIPVYNEEGHLRRIAEATLEVMPDIALAYELIIVDDGSTDSTGEIAEELAQNNKHVRVIHHDRNRKMGAALLTGYRNAKYEFVAPLTGAGHISPGELRKFVPLMQDADIVVGTWEDLSYSADRTIFHDGRTALARLLFGPHIASAPIYMFRRRVLEDVSLRSATGFLNIELVLRMQRKGYRVRVLPVTWLPRQGGKSKSTNIRTILMIVFDMLKVRLSL